MKNVQILIIAGGLLALSTVGTLARELEADVVLMEASEEIGYDLSSIKGLDVIHIVEASDLGWDVPSMETLTEALTLKVPVYSVSLPDENKIVLVKDPKGFHEQALKHKMEYIAIKPTLKSEYWEFVPVFSVEKAVTFNPKTTVEKASEEDIELLRIVAVADFIRYN